MNEIEMRAAIRKALGRAEKAEHDCHIMGREFAKKIVELTKERDDLAEKLAARDVEVERLRGHGAAMLERLGFYADRDNYVDSRIDADGRGMHSVMESDLGSRARDVLIPDAGKVEADVISLGRTLVTVWEGTGILDPAWVEFAEAVERMEAAG